MFLKERQNLVHEDFILFIRVATLDSLFNVCLVCFILIEPRFSCMSGMVFDDFTTGLSRKA